MAYPRTRQAIEALPYKLNYGHWGLEARLPDVGWGQPGKQLAEVSFPVSTRGPYDPPDVQDRCFDELDRKARAALAEA